jgi:hypothetical protein
VFIDDRVNGSERRLTDDMIRADAVASRIEWRKVVARIEKRVVGGDL